MKGLTNRQEAVLSYLKAFIRESQYPPTIREVADHFSISVKGAYDHLKALEKKGFIHERSSKSRSIIITDFDSSPVSQSKEAFKHIPLVGEIPAGVPFIPEEIQDESFLFPLRFTARHKELFALRVVGDSMKDAGICNGDIAIMGKTQKSQSGDIVAALLDGQVTLKRLIIEQDRAVLHPENSSYTDIIPSEDFTVLGRLVTLLREYDS